MHRVPAIRKQIVTRPQPDASYCLTSLAVADDERLPTACGPRDTFSRDIASARATSSMVYRRIGQEPDEEARMAGLKATPISLRP